MAGTLADTICRAWGRLTAHEREVILALHGIDAGAPDALERLRESVATRALRLQAKFGGRKAMEAK